MTVVTQWIAANGPLRDDMGVDEAAAVLVGHTTAASRHGCPVGDSAP